MKKIIALVIFILILFIAGITALFLMAIKHKPENTDVTPIDTTLSTASPTPPQDQANDEGIVFVYIKIPEAIMPMERGEKYEDTLNEALQKAGLGEVHGGGSLLSQPNAEGSRDIEHVGIDVDLNDLERGIPLLKAELKKLGAPKDTVIEYEINGESKSEKI